MRTYPADFKRVVDGDTIELNVDCGFRIFTSVHMRISEVNAPELSTPEGQAALLWAVQWFHDQLKGVVMMWPLAAEIVGPDKFAGRWVGDILMPSGKRYREELLASGNAVVKHY